MFQSKAISPCPVGPLQVLKAAVKSPQSLLFSRLKILKNILMKSFASEN